MIQHGFLITFASGIFAGCLIALMVWMLPATLLGNVIGGLILVTWLNHAQVTSGDSHKK